MIGTKERKLAAIMVALLIGGVTFSGWLLLFSPMWKGGIWFAYHVASGELAWHLSGIGFAAWIALGVTAPWLAIKTYLKLANKETLWHRLKRLVRGADSQ